MAKSFFSLPRELRDMIYHDVWDTTQIVFLHDGIPIQAIYALSEYSCALEMDQKKRSKKLCWLLTNHQIFSEGMAQFYRRAWFRTLLDLLETSPDALNPIPDHGRTSKWHVPHLKRAKNFSLNFSNWVLKTVECDNWRSNGRVLLENKLLEFIDKHSTEHGNLTFCIVADQIFGFGTPAIDTLLPVGMTRWSFDRLYGKLRAVRIIVRIIFLTSLDDYIEQVNKNFFTRMFEEASETAEKLICAEQTEEVHYEEDQRMGKEDVLEPLIIYEGTGYVTSRKGRGTDIDIMWRELTEYAFGSSVPMVRVW